MSSGLLPPFGEPPGERVDDATVLSAYLGGADGGVFSDRFHIETTVLVVGGDLALALRVGPRTFLVRVDVPDADLPARRVVEAAMQEHGMTLLDGETLLAAPVAIQRVGLRFSTWDLWGAQIDESFADLRTAAAGEYDDLFPEGIPPVGGPPE